MNNTAWYFGFLIVSCAIAPLIAMEIPELNSQLSNLSIQEKVKVPVIIHSNSYHKTIELDRDLLDQSFASTLIDNQLTIQASDSTIKHVIDFLKILKPALQSYHKTKCITQLTQAITPETLKKLFFVQKAKSRSIKKGTATKYIGTVLDALQLQCIKQAIKRYVHHYKMLNFLTHTNNRTIWTHILSELNDDNELQMLEEDILNNVIPKNIQTISTDECLGLSHDCQQYAAIGIPFDYFNIIQINPPTTIARLPFGHPQSGPVAWSENNRYFAIVASIQEAHGNGLFSFSDQLQVWDLLSAQCIVTFIPDAQSKIKHIFFLQDPAYLAFYHNNSDDIITVLHIPTKKIAELEEFRENDQFILCLTNGDLERKHHDDALNKIIKIKDGKSPQGNFFAKMQPLSSSKINLFSAATDEKTILANQHTISNIAWSPDDAYLAAYGEGKLTIWDVKSKKCMVVVEIFKPTDAICRSVINTFIWSINNMLYTAALRSGIKQISLDIFLNCKQFMQSMTAKQYFLLKSIARAMETKTTYQLSDANQLLLEQIVDAIAQNQEKISSLVYTVLKPICKNE